MLTKLAIRTLIYQRGKYAGVVLGVASACFLALLQLGFYFGFQRDILVVPDSIDADLWIGPRNLLAVDYVLPFDDLPRWQVLNDPDVDASAGVLLEWLRWRRADSGATESVQVVGIEFAGGVPVNLGVRLLDERSVWQTTYVENVTGNRELATLLALPGNVVVDEKHLERLGVRTAGSYGAELHGRHVNVVGVMNDKKLFSTACLVVTDLDNARIFVDSSNNRVSFVVVKARQGANLAEVKARLASMLPEYEVWDAAEFRGLTRRYWERLTGVGPVLLLGAVLGALVGFITVFLTFTHLTMDSLPVYAAMKALGASTKDLMFLVSVQIGVVYILGCGMGLGALAVALVGLRNTTISIGLNAGIVGTCLGLIGLCSVVAGARAVFGLSRIDPADAFGA